MLHLDHLVYTSWAQTTCKENFLWHFKVVHTTFSFQNNTRRRPWPWKAQQWQQILWLIIVRLQDFVIFCLQFYSWWWLTNLVLGMCIFMQYFMRIMNKQQNLSIVCYQRLFSCYENSVESNKKTNTLNLCARYPMSFEWCKRGDSNVALSSE